MTKKSKISVQGAAISVQQFDGDDYISLTDMAKKFGDDQLIYNWMRNRNTLEFLGNWEQLNNPGFKGFEFETFKTQACLNSFSLSVQRWIDADGLREAWPSAAFVQRPLAQMERDTGQDAVLP